MPRGRPRKTTTATTSSKLAQVDQDIDARIEKQEQLRREQLAEAKRKAQHQKELEESFDFGQLKLVEMLSKAHALLHVPIKLELKPVTTIGEKPQVIATVDVSSFERGSHLIHKAEGHTAVVAICRLLEDWLHAYRGRVEKERKTVDDFHMAARTVNDITSSAWEASRVQVCCVDDTRPVND